MGFWRNSATDDVRKGIARAISAAHSGDLADLPIWLHRVLTEELHRGWRDAGDQRFASVEAWVMHPLPQGLGLHSVPGARLLRSVLLDIGFEGAWAAVLPHIARGPGRPKTLVAEDGFQPFWRVTRADNGRDRKIMKLYRHHAAIYQRLCAHQITLADGMREAGFAARREQPLPRCGLPGTFRTLCPDRQIEVLESLWELMDQNTKSRFLDRIEVVDAVT